MRVTRRPGRGSSAPASPPRAPAAASPGCGAPRSEEHTSELQSQSNLVCRLLLEKKTSLLVGTDNVVARYNVQAIIPVAESSASAIKGVSTNAIDMALSTVRECLPDSCDLCIRHT